MNRKLLSIILALVLAAAAGFFKYNENIVSIPNADEALAVRYIDVGQADCSLISFPDGRHMLIDAGTTDAEETLPPYLKSLGIKKIDYVIGTHPHEDHIGGLDAVINSFEIGEIYMPRAVTSTKTYKDVLTSVKNKGLSVNTAKSGKIIIDEPTIRAELLAPVNDTYESLNNYSAVLKLQFGNTSFLFTGDAEMFSENEMLNSFDASVFKCDVLKVGHHGSTTSTSDRFFTAVSPKYAVIQCGTGNSYGHPHREIVQKLDKNNVITYRTDLNGTITAVSDGTNIIFTTEK